MAKQYVQDPSGTITEAYTYEYDSLGRIIQSRQEDVNGETVQRIQQLYDNANRLKTQYWEIQGDSYSESYTYDTGDGSLESMTTAGGQTLSYTYDFLKRHSATTVKNGSSTIFTVAKSYYNQTADTTLTTAQVQYYNIRNSAGTLIAGSQYVYDARGNITQIKESESPYRLLVAYEYDSLNQLTKETVYTYTGTSTTASSTTVNTFAYDTAGNLLSVSENGVVKDTYTYGNANWADLLTKFNGTAISYDASGNPLNWYNGNTYSDLNWVMGRQLESMTVETDSEELGISYSYDMSGIRSGKTVVVGAGTGGGDEGGIVVPGCDHEWVEINRTEYHIFYQCTKCSSTYQEPIQAPPTEYSLRSSSPTEHHEYIYASGKLMREIINTTANGTSTTEILDFVYGSGSTPLALVYTNGTASPVTYYYVTNMQGDVVKLVSAGGTVVASYAYDAWGKVLSAEGDMAAVNPIRYRGYYYDSETELYYLQSRYYDPVVRRFVNADGIASTGQGFLGYNMFAYCNNCPVEFSDNNGWIASRKTDADNRFFIEDDEMPISVNITRPGDYPPDSPNFDPPKGGNRKVKNPNGPGKGWLDKHGRIWVWTPNMHGGEGWTIQYPNGGHHHEYPGGHVRYAQLQTEMVSASPFRATIGVALCMIVIADDMLGILIDDPLLVPAAACFMPTIKEYYYCEVCGQLWT